MRKFFFTIDLPHFAESHRSDGIASIGSTKMTWKTKTGVGCGVMSGVQNNSF
jgi:hypothetical protein